ncbi:hypothetical protein [Trinickia fusca]|nr:hypothetical protein [Trinickia fusca]
MFYLNYSPVNFFPYEFRLRVEIEGGKDFRWLTSSMNGIHQLIKDGASGETVRRALGKLPAGKAVKYEKSIKYLIFNYPGVVDSYHATGAMIGRPVSGRGFKDVFNENRLSRQVPDGVGDMVYGLAPARSLDIYAGKREGGSPYFYCDDFNGAIGVATRGVFNFNKENGWDLSVKPGDIVENINRAALDAKNLSEWGISREAMGAYAGQLAAGRYSPARSLSDKPNKLSRELPEPLPRGGLNGQDPNLLMHARYSKAIRRACKHGIAMVARSELFRSHGCRVHFILDMLGDLGNIPMKLAPERTGGNYVPITYSELSFCFRYWRDVRECVRFFVAGQEVNAPWESNWRLIDATGKPVFANQEAWRRYALYREICRRGDVFPY